MKVCILPFFNNEDKGDGGIRRVVEAQERYLPQFGWDVTHDPFDCDIVAQHAGYHVDIPATLPLVSHCHGLYWYGYTWAKWALKLNKDVIKAMRRADVVTAPSKWVAHAIAMGTNINAPVLYHGIDASLWTPRPSQDYVLWNKTRIDSVCDPREMMRLAEMASDVRFVSTVAWPPNEIPPNVEVTGVLPPGEGKTWIESAGVYLCTTRETFGIGTLEAMAAGVPILGWDWGGQSEIVTHKKDGWLAPPEDYNSLLEGLRYCLAHRQEMGKAARETVLRDFTWEKAIERYLPIYRSLVDRPAHPRVSVVIPAYNMERFLPDAIESVTNQTYKDWELVIVDDASTDNTATVAHMAATVHPQIRVVENETNLYLAEALNVGINNARGDYILPLDADNMLGADTVLGILAESLDKDREISIAYGAMSVIEEDGNEWVSSWPPQFDYRRQMKHQNQITSTSMYRRSAWERVGGYRRRCRTAEDADFWCRASSFGANAKRVTDAVVLRYRNRADSMSHVQQDWGWHSWYPWGKRIDMTPWLAPVDGETTEPVIPAHEFPLVSIVIPVGPGHERLVLDALDSIRAQTFIWWEAIVVNDTGNPIPWLPAWARTVSTDSSHGAGAARNAGMELAKGRFFLFLDADDYLQPEALELMVTEQHRGGGFVYSDWFKQETSEVYPAPEWDGCDSVLVQLPWPVTCLYPREVWTRVGGFDEQLPAWEDWDFAIRVVEAGYCGTRVATPLFHYRIYSGARRETGVANNDDLKRTFFERYKHYIKKEKPMPCGCSGGGGLPSLPALDLYSGAMAVQSSQPASTEDTELIEFLGDVAAPITYSGQTTGTRYKFGSDDAHRVRWVYKSDVANFLNYAEFRRYGGADAMPTLAAAGPPR